MQTIAKGCWIKTGAAGLAYLPLPMGVLAMGLCKEGIISDRVGGPIITAGAIYYFPAGALLHLLETCHLSRTVWGLSAMGLMLAWSSLMAVLFWRAAGTFLGEDEPPEQRGKFDWIRFQVRFFFGFVVGFLFGWRFVKDSTSNATLLTACFIGGLIGGFGFGLSQPPNFWSRP